MSDVESLLLVVAALGVLHLGYVWGRRERRRRRQQAFDSMSTPYFEGINQLFKGDVQRALKVFVESCPLREDTVETYLLMAELFSKQGDLRQAINLHRRILSSDQLSPEAHRDAQLGLARDYISGGLFGQARPLLNELIKDDPSLRLPALRLMRDICELESDWEGAIEYSRTLCSSPVGSRGREDRQRWAHYLCEQAEPLLQEGELLRAQEVLREAVTAHPNCSRVWHLLCRLELRLGRELRALNNCVRALREDPDMAPTYAEDLLRCIPEDASMEDASRRMAKLLSDSRTRGWALLCLSQHAERSQGAEAAMAALLETIADHPSLRRIERLLQLQAESFDGPDGETLGRGSPGHARLAGPQPGLPVPPLRLCGQRDALELSGLPFLGPDRPGGDQGGRGAALALNERPARPFAATLSRPFAPTRSCIGPFPCPHLPTKPFPTGFHAQAWPYWAANSGPWTGIPRTPANAVAKGQSGV